MGDYPTVNDNPWDYKFREQLTCEKAKRQEKQSRTGYSITEASSHWFVDDINIPIMKPKGLIGFVAII